MHLPASGVSACPVPDPSETEEPEIINRPAEPPVRTVAAEFGASKANKSPVQLRAQPHTLPVAMQGSLVLSLLAVLLAAANGEYSCSSCMNSPEKCSLDTHQCTVNSSDGACMFTLETVSSGGQDTETRQVYATCVENSTTCLTGPISLTVGTGKQVRTNSMCCQSNLCNQNITMAVPPKSSPENGLRCAACNEPNADQCKTSVNVPCMGSQVYCIDFAGTPVNSTNTTLILKGCATQSACELQVNGSFYYSQQTYMLTKAGCVPATSEGSNAAVHALPFFPTLAGLLLVKQLS
ncbi:phospholipase A2 inhibitor and Ly6/PLAUR domain-containing protein-like [Pangshura tecta]